MKRESYSQDNRDRYIIRFVFDVSFFIVINIVLMNIIFGIIIDTFKELRSQNMAKIEDRKNICFICSLHRHSFENVEGGFEVHNSKDHDVWGYLFYLYSLKNKNGTEYSGIESYVVEMIKKDNHFWIPIGKAISLAKQSEEEDDIEERLEMMYQAALKFDQTLDSVIEHHESNIEKLAKQ